MTPERWRQIEEIFQTVIERPPDERKSLLTQYCGGDAELRHEVESLLDHQVADAFIQEPIKGAAQSLSDDLIGHRLGAYQVARLVGRGGMGAVYEAARADGQYEQRAALKVIKRGMETDFALERFTRERRIMAQLDHPNIARLLDGGTTADGRPYFVMEYVEGRAISEHCEADRLSINEMLKLFRQVCAAVQFAHLHLVAHRDLKPSNILVTKDGTAKLLDFGIAKLLAPDPSLGAVTQTETALRAMTPEYASPEQARGLPITAATDIYSLGVVLYELLTNRRPQQFKTYSPAEIERAICETDPPKPSEAVSLRTDAPAKLARQLAGDLDNIVMMAMRKEPERRYQSVEQFSEDIRRHLEGLPVIARNDTISYRAGKFFRRNKLAVTATMLVMLSLMGGVVMANYQARRAERRFQQVRKLANTFLFDFHDKIQNLPGSTEAREMVVKTALEYLDSLAAEAGDDPALEWELAMAYQKVGDVQGDPWDPSLGRPDQAMKSYEKAMALAQKLAVGAKDDLKIQRALARGYFKIGALRAETGDKDNSWDFLRRSVTISEEVARRSGERPDARYLTDCYVRLGDVYLDTGDARAGLEFYRKSLEVSKLWAQKLKDDNTLFAVGGDHAHVGEALASLGDLPNATENYRQAVNIKEEVAGRNPNNNHYKRDLRVAYSWMGNLAGNPNFINAADKATAMKYYRQALTIAEEIAAADSKNATARSDLISSYNALGDVLSESDPAGSVEYYRQALSLVETLLEGSPGDQRVLRRQAYSLRGIAAPLGRLGERDAALRNLRQSLQIMRELSSRYPTNPQVRSGLHASLLALADAMAKAGDHRSALDHCRQALDVATALAAAARSDVYARWRLADSYGGLAQLHELLATQPKTSPTERGAHRGEACAWRRKALEVWDSWNQYGVSSGFNTAKRQQAAHALAQCEVALANLSASPHG